MSNFTSKTYKSGKTLTRADVRQMITSRAECKAFLGHLSTALSTSGSVTYLSGIAEDDSITGRAGHIVRPSSIHYRLLGVDETSNLTRLILFQDYLANGAIAAVTDVLTSANCNASYNATNIVGKRFKILSDITVGTSADGFQAYSRSKTIPLKGTIKYVGSGATSASAGAGAIGVLLITQTGTPTVDLSTVIRYTDS